MQQVWQAYKPAQGHPDWEDLQRRAAALVAQAVPLLPPRSRPRDFWRVARSLSTIARTFQANRATLARGDEAIRPLFFIWTMLNACNFDCSYCDNHQGMKYPDLPNRGALGTAQGKQLLKVMRTRTTAIYFCGGEPTLRPDLPDLVEEASRLGYFPMMVNTNASRLHHLLLKPGGAGWLSHIDAVIVSLDALNLDVLREMYGFATPEDVIVNTLALAALSRRMGFKVVVNCVIQPGLIDEARAVFDFSQDIGCTFACLPMNTGPEIAGGLRDDPEYLTLAREIIGRAARGARVAGGPRIIESLLFSEPRRCLPTTFVHVDPDGTVIWPCKPAVRVGPHHVQALGKSNLDQIWAEAKGQFDPTGFRDSDACSGECNWLQHYVADAYVKALRNPRSQAWALREALALYLRKK